jgi:uncharacterized membrane protein
MNSAQMHLALTHVPVLLSLVGLAMLIVAWLKKNTTLTKTSYILILIAGVVAVPVFFTGEGAEETVEHSSGVSEGIIERHADMARLAMISIAATGVLALAAWLSFKWHLATRVLKPLVLVVAVISAGLMIQTAHLGGQIRHTEIRNGVAVQDEKKGVGEGQTGGYNGQDDD